MIKDLKFNHFGLAVKDSNKSKFFFNKLGYKEYKDVIDDNQKVRALLMKKENYFDIEILSKIHHDDKSPIDNLIQDNKSAIYHICYECTDIDKLIYDFKKENILFRKIVKEMFSPLFNKDVSFYLTDSIGVVEIIHLN
tara:strand:+ start:511 stop:924 length:414 start_codon:yes stop_codon:yes gene_type:complete